MTLFLLLEPEDEAPEDPLEESSEKRSVEESFNIRPLEHCEKSTINCSEGSKASPHANEKGDAKCNAAALLTGIEQKCDSSAS